MDGRPASAASGTRSAREEDMELARRLAGRHQWLFRLPFIERAEELGEVTAAVAEGNPHDFNWAVSFDEDFLGTLMFEGFLPMCERLEPDAYVVMPKLHAQRSVLDLEDLHVAKSTRRKAVGHTLRMDTAIDRVCDAIIQQHGENWFYPPLVAALKRMSARGTAGCARGRVFVHSFELYRDSDGALVAGEVGYRFGGCYASLSGFSVADSAGSIQLAATGAFLIEQGLSTWDLGMSIPYKETMGSRSLSRADFLARLHACRDAGGPPYLTLGEGRSALELVRWFASLVARRKEEEQAAARAAPSAQPSKSQSKKAAKRERRLEMKRAKATKRTAAVALSQRNEGGALGMAAACSSRTSPDAELAATTTASAGAHAIAAAPPPEPQGGSNLRGDSGAG